MDLYLQFGYGMMGLDLEFARRWGQAKVILSPRDLEPEQLVRHSAELQEVGSLTFVDPQFYLPRADHHRLTSYSYWPDNFETQEFDGDSLDPMVSQLALLNEQANSARFIVPGRRATVVDDQWAGTQTAFRRAVLDATSRPIMATICLSPEVVRDTGQVSAVVQTEETEPAEAYYLVLETPGISYLSDDPQWLANALDLVAGLKRLGSAVVVGYANQQQLIAASAGADAIASGTWMNVRSFPPDKFMESEAEPRQRAVWYYLPQALSEFKLPFLDIAIRLGQDDVIRPNPLTEFADPLLSARQPSASGWSEPDAFRHFLEAIRNQARRATRQTFSETIQHHRVVLDNAQTALNRLHEVGVFGQHRDFGEAIDAQRAALLVLERTQGPVLEREWREILGALA